LYAHRSALGPVDLAFTDRYGGVSASPYDELNLAISGDDDDAAKAENRRRLLADFAPDDVLCDLHQVHGAEVVLATPEWPQRPRADGIVSTTPGLTLLVRAADCVPVLLVAPEQGVVGAAHSGRPGLMAGVVPATVARMRELGEDPDVADREELGDHDQPDVLRGPAGVGAGTGDALLHGVEPRLDLVAAAHEPALSRTTAASRPARSPSRR